MFIAFTNLKGDTEMTPYSFDNTEGCFFLAAIFTSVLWGVGSVQLYLYYESHSSRDMTWLKIYVFFAWALDTVHEALLLKAVYTYLVSDIGDLLALEHSSKEFALTTILIPLVDIQVQLFFTWRIWKLSEKNKVLVGSLLTFMLTLLIASAIAFTGVYVSKNYAKVDIPNSSKLSMSIAAFVDTTLALALIFLLRRKQNRIIAFSATKPIIGRIMKYAIGTSLIIAAFAIAGLIALFVSKGNLYYLVVTEMFPKVYVNCMLFSLNMRPYQREGQTESALGEKGMVVPASAFKLTSISTESYDTENRNMGLFSRKIPLALTNATPPLRANVNGNRDFHASWARDLVAK